jgi:hypothetical protein
MRTWKELIVESEWGMFEPLVCDPDYQSMRDVMQSWFTMLDRITPDGYRWRTIYCSEGENSEGEDLMAAALAGTGTAFMIRGDGGSVYVVGTYAVGRSGMEHQAFVTWGLGCPMQSAGCEVMVLVKEGV